MANLLTDEQDCFLRKMAKNRSNSQITDILNARFNLNISVSQIKSYKKNHKISSGLTGRFEKGSVPYNKGIKRPGMISSTSFKKGNKPHNYKPVGSERITKDGYVEIKIKDPNTWALKHIVVWEAEHGKRPKNTAIVFADQNKLNFSLDNLILIKRSELLICNRKQLLTKDKNITCSGIALSKLIDKVYKLRK